MTDSVELRATLTQLCSDLLAPDVSRDDQRDILRSLSSLVEQFPLSKKSLGRLLSDQQAPGDDASKLTASTAAKAFRPLLAELASHCLYDRVTSKSTITLLAALAHDNSINQRRIVRWVPGVRLQADSFADNCDAKTAKRWRGSDLFVLTVPEPIKVTYRKWRKRQRAIHTLGGCGRVPMGTPPSKDGVPMPCYCDDCLGAEQLLSTWCRHFNDLTRWTADPNVTTDDNAGECGPGQDRPVLSTPDFFRMELTDYQLLSCRCAAEPVSDAEQLVGDRRCGRIYYFVPRDQATSAVKFDPVHHLSAILIPSDVFDAVEQTRQLPSSLIQRDNSAGNTEARQRGGSRTADEGEEAEVDPLDGLDEVILLDDRLATTICDCEAQPRYDPLLSDAVESLSPTEATLTGEGAIVTLCIGQQGISRADLLAKLDGQSPLKESGSVLLRLVLEFFADEEMISVVALDEAFGHLGCPSTRKTSSEVLGSDSSTAGETPGAGNGPAAAPIDAQAMARASLSAQKLRIEFVVDIDALTLGESSSRAVYAVDLLQSDVVAALALSDTPMAIISLSDEDLRSILSRCRICRRQGRHEDDKIGIAGGSRICLRFNRFASLDRPTIEHQPNEGEAIPSHDDTSPVKTSGDKPSGPLPGMPDAAKTVLTRILNTIEGACDTLDGAETLTSLVQQLSAAIASCNSQIRELSTSRGGATAHARLAATDRCRACRDELIQLCKQMKLAREERSEQALSAAGGAHGLLSSRKRQARLQRSVCVGLQSVLAASERFDTWETPDERVDALHLDRSAWASGVPDFEFFQEREARAANNKRRQRELSRRLQAQHRRAGGG